MRIMYFLDEGKNFGGAANTLLQQAVLMKNAGYEVCLVISNYRYKAINDSYYSICSACDIEILRAPFQISSHPEDIDLLGLLETYPYVYEIISMYKPDVLHSIQINPSVELVARELRIPHIMNIYQILPEFFSVEYSDIFPKFHLCDSECYASMWNQLIGCESTCIRTVVNEKNVVKKNKYIERDNIIFCCVGYVIARKNQLGVIKAFEMALKEGIKAELLICGSDVEEYAKECHEYIEEHKLSKNIRMLGFCKDMENVYEVADVLICGSTMESYPNVISEALANDLVVISTSVAGVPEVIIDGYNGYLCEDYSEEAIYKKIMQYNEDRYTDKLRMIKANASITFQKEHSSEMVKQKLLGYYNSVCEKFSDTMHFPGIEKIEIELENILSVYKKNKFNFTNRHLVVAKLWYIAHIKKAMHKVIAENGNKVFIWGAGKNAVTIKEVIDVFFSELTFEGCVDSFKTGMYLERPIVSYKNFREQCSGIIFVGSLYGQKEILETLKNDQKELNKDYFLLVPRNW